MSLHQIKHIGSVGRFRAASASGDVTFKKFTLIFGENGRGKTTLCSILRSLQNNDPAIVLGRKTLGEDKDPHIVLTFAGGSVLFKSGAWNSQNKKLRIFDSQYVAENVYFGDSIGTDQRRNLCRVMLGRDGVVLARAYDDADAAITIKNNEIKEVRKQLTAHVAAQQIEEFIALFADSEIDDRIGAKAREVEGLKEIDTLRTRASLHALEFPAIPTRLEQILGKTLENVSKDAEDQVKRHLVAHGMDGKEEWLSTGIAFAKDDDCPFCGQYTDGLELIAAYRAYFNATYTAFKKELEQYTGLPNKHYSDDRIEILSTRVASNTTSADVWKRYVTFKPPQLKEDVAAILTTFRSEMVALLEEKNANPLGAVELSAGYRAALDKMTKLAEYVQTYNEAVAAANKAIDAFKKSASASRLQSAQNELKWLQLTKKRHEPPLKDACDEYVKLNAEKEALDKRKVEARSKLDEYSSTVVEGYRKSINAYLNTFTAGFQLDRMRVEYSGRVPNSTFCVVINDTHVEMGNGDTPIGEPSFRNTLSAGDKSTLALAFFLAQLKADPDKGDCIAVFDDPFNSQDQFRKTCTMSEIRRCGRDVMQVIIMSHDARFLRDLWDQLQTSDRKALWLLPFGHKDTTIADWPIETDTESDDAANRRVLLAYYQDNEGNARDVIQKIRPVIETHMQRMAPELASINGLGNKLGEIRKANGPPLLLNAYDEIDDINIYTRKYMHGEGKNPDTEPISKSELVGFVHKVLVIAGALAG
jgi:wobble nucleotide-excising tRNase